jgi:hypothetical protein
MEIISDPDSHLDQQHLSLIMLPLFFSSSKISLIFFSYEPYVGLPATLAVAVIVLDLSIVVVLMMFDLLLPPVIIWALPAARFL